MKIKCPYCDTMFDDTLINCPNCGAASEGVVRTESKQPLTIAQLQQWYQERGLPPYETTRFFIGEDYRKPRAFGIYQDEATGNFVVYKNLANGQRKVRYEGTDEAYAVNELYMRLKEEIIQQKRNAVGRKNGSGSVAKTIANSGVDADTLKSSAKKLSGLVPKLLIVLGVMIAIVVVISVIASSGDDSFSSTTASDDTSPYIGYYLYDDTNYYHALCNDTTDDWYYFDTDSDRWEHTYDALPADLTDLSTANDFYYTPDWDSATQENDFGALTAFDNSEYAAQYEDTSDDWFNDNDDDTYDWDTDDTWDNGTTDWDTDW